MTGAAPHIKTAIYHIEELVPNCELFIEPDKSYFVRDPGVSEDI